MRPDETLMSLGLHGTSYMVTTTTSSHLSCTIISQHHLKLTLFGRATQFAQHRHHLAIVGCATCVMHYIHMYTLNTPETSKPSHELGRVHPSAPQQNWEFATNLTRFKHCLVQTKVSLCHNSLAAIYYKLSPCHHLYSNQCATLEASASCHV